MKTLHFTIITIMFLLSSCFAAQSASASYSHGNMDIEKISDSTITQLEFNNSIITFEQYLNKTTYNVGETIYVYGQLRNVGNNNVYVTYPGPATSSVLKDQSGKLEDSFGGAYVLDGGPYGNATLYPNTTTILKTWDFPRTVVGGGPWTLQTQPAELVADKPGIYYVRSMVHFNYDSHTISEHSKTITLWSQPLQITVQNKQPIKITQVELDSPFVILPDNQTCYDKPGFTSSYTCSESIVSGKKIQCAYFIGSSTCEPIHQYTGGTNHACLDFSQVSRAPQWFDMYNTENESISILLFDVQTLQNMKSWGDQSLVPIPITLGPHEGCTYGFGPIDEPLALDQTNMSFAVTYAYEGKNYTATTTPLTDLYNDSATWQLVGDKWVFAQQNTLKIPEFPLAILILSIGIISTLALYRIKYRK